MQTFTRDFEQAAPSLYAWARLHIGASLRRRIDPEDLLQEVCCRAFVRYADFDPRKGNFRAWLFGFAHNVLKEVLRSLRTRGESIFVHGHTTHTVGFEQIADDATAISQRIARQEGLDAFLLRVEELESDDRRLLLYRGIEGRSHAELAELFGSTVASMEKRWQRLVAKVRKWKAPTGVLLNERPS